MVFWEKEKEWKALLVLVAYAKVEIWESENVRFGERGIFFETNGMEIGKWRGEDWEVRSFC